MNAADEKRIAAMMAKTLAMISVRNTGIDTLHSGIVPVTHAGDWCCQSNANSSPLAERWAGGSAALRSERLPLSKGS
jgi:hypothetical protein